MAPNPAKIDSGAWLHYSKAVPKLSIPQRKMELDLPDQANLMQSLLAAGLPVASSCGGDGICGKCKMNVAARCLPPPSPLEAKTLTNAQAEPGERLSCQLTLDCNTEVKTTYW